MCAVKTRDREQVEPRPWRALLWIAIAGLIFGVFAIGETGAAVSDPLVQVPPETSCVVKLYTPDSTTDTFHDYSAHGTIA